MGKIVITVVGKDKIGIIAKVCQFLSDNEINILDISQTIVDGFFNMMMIAEMENEEMDFEKFSDDLDELGKGIGVVIKVQKEEIFEMMHRI